MMDYLTSLVARNLELIKAVQPRLASRFEPSNLAIGSLQTGSSWRVTTAEAQPVSESETRTLPSLGSRESPRLSKGFHKNSATSPQHHLDLMLDKSSHRRPVQAQDQHLPIGIPPKSESPRKEDAAVQSSQNPSLAKPDQSLMAPSHFGDRRLTGSKALPGLTPEQAVVISAAPENPVLSRPSEGLRRKSRTSSDQIIQPALAEHTSPAEDGSGTPTPILPTSQEAKLGIVVRQPQVTPYVQAASSPQTESARMPQAVPVIRVTIGRVEVRAIMAAQAPPQPRAQAQPGPSLSLEDYLKEREGGQAMSNALAIAAVTAVLKDLLNNGLIDHNLSAGVGEVTVSALPPDRIDALEDDLRKSRLNLFLYQVTPNTGWRNVGLPSHNGRGDRVDNPPLALDLHYLLTAYGAEEFHAEILLGYAMQLLHETPVLPRDAIRIALAPPTPVLGGGNLPPAMQALFTSDLAEQVEQIKITPQFMNTEELSKLWPAFQAKYRPTAIYQVSVVLIESRRSTRPALPVRERRVHVVPFQHPVIEQVKSQASVGGPIKEDQLILAGFNLVIVGSQLRGEDTVVRVGGIEVTPAAGDVTDNQIIVPIPGGLQAGVQGVQVIQRTLLGSPPTPHRGFESNVAAFVLSPRLVPPIGIADLQGTGTELRSARLDLTVDPAIGDTQRVVLFLNELTPLASPPGPEEGKAQAYSFIAPSRFPLSPPSPPGPSQNISIPITGVKAGDYLVRIQVDGAESPLGTDAAGQYNSPMVTIP